MKKLLFIVLAFAFAASGNGGALAIGTGAQSNPSFEAALEYLDGHATNHSHAVLHDIASYDSSDNNVDKVSKPTAHERVTIPADTADSVLITSTRLSLAVNVRQAGLQAETLDMASGPRSYTFSDGSSISPIVKNDGSIQFISFIPNESASNKFKYRFDSYGPVKLAQSQNSGLVAIIGEQSRLLAEIAPAWAVDSAGRAVPTRYEIDGQNLIQVIDTGIQGITYPIVADPWLGFDLIDHTAWVNTNTYSPTLSVFPTGWGITVGAATTFPLGGPVLSLVDSLSVSAAWSETLSKTARTGHPNPDTTSMFEQFECHFFYVSKKIPAKSSWNLDSRRPEANLALQVLNQCNVP